MPSDAASQLLASAADSRSSGALSPAAAEVALVMEKQQTDREQALAMLESRLPEGWIACTAEGGEVYYHNATSGLSQWSNPSKTWASCRDAETTAQCTPLLAKENEMSRRSRRRYIKRADRLARDATNTIENTQNKQDNHSVYDARSRHVELPTPASLFSDSGRLASREDLHGRAFAIHGLLSGTEAESYAASAQAAGFQDSDVHHEFPAEVRNNSRLVHFSEALAQTLWRRLEPFLMHKDIYLLQPMGYCAEGRWKPVGVNPCFRISRYLPREQFAKHCDGMYANDNGECSIYSLVLYLNSDFEGGELELPEQTLFAPRAGSAVLFPHDTLHEARCVTAGTKYVARSELMFRCVDRGAPPSVPAYVDDPLFQKMAALYEQIGDLARAGDADLTTAAYQEALGIQIQYKGTTAQEPSMSGRPLEDKLLARALSFLDPFEVLTSRSSNRAWSVTTQLGRIWQELYRHRWPTTFGLMDEASRGLDSELKDWLGLYRRAHAMENNSSVCTVFLTETLQASTNTEELQPVWAGARHEDVGIGWDTSFKQRAGWHIGESRYRHSSLSAWLENREIQWRILPELFAYAFRSLGLHPSETRLLVPLVPGLWFRSARARLVRILMGRFEVPKIHFPPAPLCALLGHGVRTGTVVWGCSLGKSVICCYKDGTEIAKSRPFKFEHVSASQISGLLRKLAKNALRSDDADVLQHVVFSCHEASAAHGDASSRGQKGRDSDRPPAVSAHQRWRAIVDQVAQELNGKIGDTKVELHAPIPGDVMLGAKTLTLSELQLFESEPEFAARWEWRWLVDGLWRKLPDYAAGVFEGALRQGVTIARVEELQTFWAANLADFKVTYEGQSFKLTRFLRGRPAIEPDRRKPEDLDQQLQQSHADDMLEVEEFVEGDAMNVRTLAGRVVFSASKQDVESLLVSDVLDEVSEIMDAAPSLLQLTCDGATLAVEQQVQDLLGNPGSVEVLVLQRKKGPEREFEYLVQEIIPEDLPGEYWRDGI
eukprot:TRINITY_DN19818_c0_g1_i1.p1 TRINITY_DN19818_c0_g1~~TRINITY_DN19818_c0_g1_i1.p1  ORF type:complete len:1000 (+),score=145.41 TRINITY_DN19818_c0_g1_i1:90-3089(+)